MLDKHPASLEDQIAFGFELTTQRPIAEKTLEVLIRLHQQLKSSYRNEQFVPLGKTPEQAASVMIANTLLNIDEAITK